MERTRLQIRKHGNSQDFEHPLVRFRVDRHVKRRCVKATRWSCCEALSNYLYGDLGREQYRKRARANNTKGV